MKCQNCIYTQYILLDLKCKNLNYVVFKELYHFIYIRKHCQKRKEVLNCIPKKLWSSLTFFSKHYRYCWCHKNQSRKSLKLMPMEWFQRHPSDYMKKIVSSSFQWPIHFQSHPISTKWTVAKDKNSGI